MIKVVKQEEIKKDDKVDDKETRSRKMKVTERSVKSKSMSKSRSPKVQRK